MRIDFCGQLSYSSIDVSIGSRQTFSVTTYLHCFTSSSAFSVFEIVTSSFHSPRSPILCYFILLLSS